MEGKNLKLADLEGGKTYYIELKLPQHNNPIWIQRWKGSAIDVKNRTFQRDWDSFGVDVTTLELRLATTEEREWLNYCIEKDKYISYEDFLKEYKPTYEKGKWYKTGKYYAKCVKHTNNEMTCSEMIMSGNFRNVNKTHYTFKSDIPSGYKWELVTDLKEIESYLPKDHPDIQQKPEKFVGRYFKALVENARCSNVIKNNYYLIEQEDDLYFRFYTEFSEDSLFCLDKSLSGIYELMPIGWTPNDVIPEYVECLEEDATYNIKNRIYKVISWKENSVWVICNLRCEGYNPGDSLCNDDWFKNNHKWKISTKEAYDLQNSKQYPLVPEKCYDTEIEVGDEVEVIQPCSSSLNKKGHIGRVEKIFQGRLIDFGSCQVYEINGWCEHISALKLVKKANKTTTLDKKVDVSSPKVTNKITVPIINTTSRDKQVHINVDIKKDGVIVPLLTTTKKSIKNIQINNLKTLTI